MSNEIILLKPAEFKRIAKQCSRWRQRSLDAAKALVVDGKGVSEVAEKFEMTKQQADTIRVRFYAKVEAARVADFLSRNPAEIATVGALRPFRGAIFTLSEQGASPDQIVAYLAERDLSTNAETVTEFLKGDQT